MSTETIAQQFTTDWAEGVQPFPFIEDENCNITDITHRWVTFDPKDDERFVFHGVTGSTPGAFPVTCLWGSR